MGWGRLPGQLHFRDPTGQSGLQVQPHAPSTRAALHSHPDHSVTRLGKPCVPQTLQMVAVWMDG